MRVFAARKSGVKNKKRGTEGTEAEAEIERLRQEPSCYLGRESAAAVRLFAGRERLITALLFSPTRVPFPWALPKISSAKFPRP